MIARHTHQTGPAPTHFHALPFVSAIIPCKNEARFIDRCLASVLCSDYPADRLEVLVVDGMSTDGTRGIVTGYARTHPGLRLLDNPRRTIPVAMNIGIRNARGDVIVKMDAHSEYPSGYLLRCVRALVASGADNVGGTIRILPSTQSVVARAIARALAHPFGSLNSAVKIGTRHQKWVDTVAYGCYRRDVFERVGLYNEDLVRSSDMDLNIRLRKAGGRILLIPYAVTYYSNVDLWGFFVHNVVDGLWATYPLKFGSRVFAPRHLAPMGLLALFVAAAVAAKVLSALGWLPTAMLAVYLTGALVSALQISVRQREWALLPVMPLVFAARHFGYAAGSLTGLALSLGSRQFWRYLLRRQTAGHRSTVDGRG